MRSISAEMDYLRKLFVDLKIRRSNVIAVTVYSSGNASVFVEMQELGRLYHLLKIPRHKLKIRRSENGSLHVDFAAKECTFSGMVAAPAVDEWLRMNGIDVPKLSAAAPAIGSQKCLPAPV